MKDKNTADENNRDFLNQPENMNIDNKAKNHKVLITILIVIGLGILLPLLIIGSCFALLTFPGGIN